MGNTVGLAEFFFGCYNAMRRKIMLNKNPVVLLQEGSFPNLSQEIQPVYITVANALSIEKAALLSIF